MIIGLIAHRALEKKQCADTIYTHIILILQL